jgi:dihydrofolate reductase
MTDTLPALMVSLVVAVAENGVIGAAGDMPWKLGSDLKRFKAITWGKPVVMGRKTHVSIGFALPGRPNLVVTRDPNFKSPGVETFPSLEAALDRADELCGSATEPEIMIIGGSEIYHQAFDMADRIYLTTVHASPEGDAHFPAIDRADWDVLHQERARKLTGDSAATTYQVLQRKA